VDGGVRLERGRGESSYSSCLLFPLALITLDHLVYHPPDRVRTHPPVLIPPILPPVVGRAVWVGAGFTWSVVCLGLSGALP
jgi:hypothetical protein